MTDKWETATGEQIISDLAEQVCNAPMTNKRLIEFGTILQMCGFRAMQIKPVRTVCTYKRVALDDMDLCNYDTCPIWAQLETKEGE